MPRDYKGGTYAQGQIEGGSGSDNSAPAPGDTDGGLSKGVIHSKAVEQNIQDKALGGGVITNDDLGEARGYLGHFANDNVASKGHNVGHKKIGTGAAVQGVAHRGYRKLPGSASPQQGRARYGTMSDAELGLRAPRFERVADAKMKARNTRAANKAGVMLQDPFPLRSTGSSPGAVNAKGGSMPPTTANAKMSIKHEKERIAFNVKHERDHHRDAQEARAKIKKIKKLKLPRA